MQYRYQNRIKDVTINSNTTVGKANCSIQQEIINVYANAYLPFKFLVNVILYEKAVTDAGDYQLLINKTYDLCNPLFNHYNDPLFVMFYKQIIESPANKLPKDCLVKPVCILLFFFVFYFVFILFYLPGFILGTGFEIGFLKTAFNITKFSISFYN